MLHPARRRTPRAGAAIAAAAALVVAGCSGDGAADETATPVGPDGQLTLVAQGPAASWDPQRITNRQTAGIASRLWMRTLTSYAPAADTEGQRKLTGDLASSTGSASKDLTSWSFSLRKGVTWEDGSAITCEDVRYGVSRAFDAETPSSGYAITYLDIAKEPDGTSTYPGPYGKEGRSSAAKKLIEKAVECDGRKVTFNLGEPVANFDEVVSLPEFAPFKESQDERTDSVYGAFSSGPYRLEKPWTPSTGGTWVRNEEWAEGSDPVRAAKPDTIVHTEGLEPDDALSSLGDAEGTRTIMLDPLPQALDAQREELGDKAQAATGDSQLVDYLAPNVESKVFAKKEVRQAFAASTDRKAYVDALGGSDGSATWSLLPTVLPSAHDPVLDEGPSGDPARAKELLAKAKVEEPVKVRLAYRSSSEEMDAAVEALRQGWERGGFEVTLVPVEQDYFEAIGARKSADDHDVVWANWGPDYPSASTVLPALFDNRINVTEESLGRDYGQVADKDLNEAMDAATEEKDDAKRAKAWAEVDTTLLQDGVYVPLRQTRVTYVAGSEVTDLVVNAAYGGVPDLGAVGVSR